MSNITEIANDFYDYLMRTAHPKHITGDTLEGAANRRGIPENQLLPIIEIWFQQGRWNATDGMEVIKTGWLVTTPAGGPVPVIPSEE